MIRQSRYFMQDQVRNAIPSIMASNLWRRELRPGELLAVIVTRLLRRTLRLLGLTAASLTQLSNHARDGIDSFVNRLFPELAH